MVCITSVCVCACVSGNIIGCRTQTRSCSIKELDKAVLSACTFLHLDLNNSGSTPDQKAPERAVRCVYVSMCACELLLAREGSDTAGNLVRNCEKSVKNHRNLARNQKSRP